MSGQLSTGGWRRRFGARTAICRHRAAAAEFSSLFQHLDQVREAIHGVRQRDGLDKRLLEPRLHGDADIVGPDAPAATASSRSALFSRAIRAPSPAELPTVVTFARSQSGIMPSAIACRESM